MIRRKNRPNKPKPWPQLWTRFGDNAEYHSHGDDMDACADMAVELGVVPPIHRASPGLGFTSWPAYTGQNYVSLYWGDASANLIRELTVREWERFQTAVADALDDRTGAGPSPAQYPEGGAL